MNSRTRDELDERLAQILARAIVRELRAEMNIPVHNESVPALAGETRSDAIEARHAQHTPVHPTP